jgi:hypothetical protein
MIVLGADTHKRSHTIAAVSAATGELIGEQTVQVGAKGFAALVVRARELGPERVWALEDCRHVSGSFERFLIERGERVVRVPTKLMADARRGARGRGTTASTRSRSRGRRCAKAWMPCRRRSSRAPNSTCGCLLTIASASSASALRSTTHCNGTCTTSGPTCGCRAARCFTATGARASRGGSRAPSRRCACASPVTSCAASASSRRRSRRWRPRSPSSSPGSRRSCSQSQGSGR